MVELAATRLIALHKNKGKSVAACLKSRTDYAQNPDKTQQGELVSSYECSPLTVDEEFMLSKRQYELMTGRRQKNDVIAYQIRQSFKPGEITAEEANKVGYELAMRFTKGKYAFIVATHTDREHIHNHIIYNSTALDSTRKFRDFLLSGLAVQRLSDLICLEHQLSVIEIKPYRERQKRTFYPPRESNRDKLCAVIDNILLNEKPTDFEAFLQTLEQQGYEIKRGKHTSVKGTRQKRFIRFRTLGAGYSEDEIKAVIAGEGEHRPHQKQPPKEQPFHLLVDIQAKLSEGKSEGYARWAKRYNLKEISKTLIFLQENKIGSIQERRLLNPLIIWNGYILDGHSRYRILKNHPEIAFEVKEIQLPDRYAALAWICQNQLGRRNLDPERRKFLMGKAYENEKLSIGAPIGNQNGLKQCVQNEHIELASRTCEKIAKRNGVAPSTVRRAERYAKGVDAAETAVPGAMEEILSGHIKATDAEITALAKMPKEEIPAIIEELRKPKQERQAKSKPPKPEKVDADDVPVSSKVHTEGEITPVSNSPPDFKRSIQGQKRCLTDEERKRLQKSIDNRHHKTTVANGSIMMCEVQGAKEDFIRRWNLVFKDYPDVFEDNGCRSAILSLIDDTLAYLQTIKERVL